MSENWLLEMWVHPILKIETETGVKEFTSNKMTTRINAIPQIDVVKDVP